jgi:hypothetical protein
VRQGLDRAPQGIAPENGMSNGCVTHDADCSPVCRFRDAPDLNRIRPGLASTMRQVEVEPFDPAAVDIAHAHGIGGAVPSNRIGIKLRRNAAILERVV